MTNKEIRRLSKIQILTLLHQQEEEIERLSALNNQLTNELESRTLKIEETGSLAQAALTINGVFQAAQDAADQYLDNIKIIQEEKTKEAEKIKKDAESYVLVILEELSLCRRTVHTKIIEKIERIKEIVEKQKALGCSHNEAEEIMSMIENLRIEELLLPEFEGFEENY